MAEIKEFIPPNKKTNAQVIALLEEWLEDAKQGNVVAIAIAGIQSNGRCMTAASGANSVSNLVGAIEMCKHRILKGHFEVDYD